MKYSRFALFLPVLLSGCNFLPNIENKTLPSNSEQYSSVISSTTDNLTTDTTYSSTTTQTQTSQDSNTTQSSDDYINGREILPCGYVKLDKPKNSPINIKTSNDNEDWYQIDIKDYLDPSLAFIYGNNSSNGPTGHYASPPFYSYSKDNEESYPGGLKITKSSQGLQSPIFTHSGKKLEIRIGISQVNNANGKPESGKPTGYIYFYNIAGNFLPNKTIEISEGSITSNSRGNYLKYYCEEAVDVAYFEFRLNAQPYKGQQNYNFGIGYLSIHSWLGGTK